MSRRLPLPEEARHFAMLLADDPRAEVSKELSSIERELPWVDSQIERTQAELENLQARRRELEVNAKHLADQVGLPVPEYLQERQV
jgi:septal ring factor EnvC (AmiA/AmiB activator)